ncbi:MAG: cytidine deaminase [Bdellovibrionaceae bacterium]|nr:cytidine deaminase [Pseudobdellovibrionaceae bacterium]|tara:strand:+ start:61340 stop:61888 length:549 start_codon:yes stop_codon:yes gene_type:complete
MIVEIDKCKVNYIKPASAVSWDEYFMLQAMLASFKSKDPATKVGAVFVDGSNHQITMGYNGFVAGVDETQLPWGKDNEAPYEHQKYAYVVHAEANAILHSPRELKDARVYVTLFPCEECAKLLASVKVKEVIYLSDKHCTKEGNKIAKKIFNLSGISYRQMNMKPGLLDDLEAHLAKQLADL